MKQVDLARTLAVSPQWFNAVVKGRADAGKVFANKASSLIGGTMDIWMMKNKRTARRELVDGYMDALRQARNGGTK